MNARLTLAAAIGALGVWAGCAAFDDAVLPASQEVGGTTSSTSTSSSSSGDSGSGCERASMVPPPNPALGTGGDIQIVVAVQTISLGLDKGKVAPDFGYDLDGLCTCTPDQGSCTRRKEAADAGGCDGDLGRDVATSGLVASLGLGASYDPSSFANESIGKGERGIVARIQNYNGQANDDEIRFSLYRARPTSKPPVWTDPDQGWDIAETDLKTDGIATFEAFTVSSGYVTDHQLVVNNLTSSRIPFNADSDLVLQQVKLTGLLELDRGNGRWNLKGAIAVGRWPLTDALQTVSRVRNPLNGDERLCENATLLRAARQKVCAAADIMDTSENDRSGRICNSISAAVTLNMVPAAFNTTFPSTPDNACSGIAIAGCE